MFTQIGENNDVPFYYFDALDFNELIEFIKDTGIVTYVLLHESSKEKMPKEVIQSIQLPLVTVKTLHREPVKPISELPFELFFECVNNGYMDLDSFKPPIKEEMQYPYCADWCTDYDHDRVMHQTEEKPEVIRPRVTVSMDVPMRRVCPTIHKYVGVTIKQAAEAYVQDVLRTTDEFWYDFEAFYDKNHAELLLEALAEHLPKKRLFIRPERSYYVVSYYL